MLDVEQTAGVGVRVEHLVPHCSNRLAQGLEIAGQRQDLASQRLETLADRWVAGREPGSGERLMLPGPGRFELIDPEGIQVRDKQAGVAVGPQAQVDLEKLAGSGAG